MMFQRGPVPRRYRSGVSGVAGVEMEGAVLSLDSFSDHQQGVRAVGLLPGLRQVLQEVGLWVFVS